MPGTGGQQSGSGTSLPSYGSNIPGSGNNSTAGNQGNPNGTTGTQGSQNGQGFPDGTGSGLPGSGGTQQAGNNGTGQGTGSGSQAGTGQGQDGAGTGSGVAYGTGDDPFADLRTGSAGGGGLSDEERIAILDARLEEGYGEFDEMIIEENRRSRDGTAAIENSTAGNGTGENGSGDGSGSESGNGSGAGEPVILATNSGAPVTGGGYRPGGNPTNTSETGTFGRGSQEAVNDVPDDIPSGDDDDVVARQLREAAMNEPDPELREKLWDEYRAYTGLSE